MLISVLVLYINTASKESTGRACAASGRPDAEQPIPDEALGSRGRRTQRDGDPPVAV